MVPTVGVYPIATANDKDQISAPLMSRFAVIDIPDYTPEEKKIIFSQYALPKVLGRMSLRKNECVLTADSQLGEHLAAEDWECHHDHFKDSNPNVEWRATLEQGEKIGLGTRQYILKKLK